MKKINWLIILIIFIFSQKISANCAHVTRISFPLSKSVFCSLAHFNSDLYGKGSTCTPLIDSNNSIVDVNDLQDEKNKTKCLAYLFIFACDYANIINNDQPPAFHPNPLKTCNKVYLVNSVFRL